MSRPIPQIENQDLFDALYDLWRQVGEGDVTLEQQTPASASAEGKAGTIAIDSNYIYVCVADDTWKRVAISTL